MKRKAIAMPFLFTNSYSYPQSITFLYLQRINTIAFCFKLFRSNKSRGIKIFTRFYAYAFRVKLSKVNQQLFISNSISMASVKLYCILICSCGCISRIVFHRKCSLKIIDRVCFSSWLFNYKLLSFSIHS